MADFSGGSESSLELGLKGARLSYKPGESLDFSDVRVYSDGEDVTEASDFEVADDVTVFPADVKRLPVTVWYGSSSAEFELKRKRSVVPFILVAIAILGVAVGVFFATRPPVVEERPEGDTGSYLIPKGDMTDEEAQALVDKMADESRITVSLAPEMQLDGDRLRVNLIVPEGNNGLSERLEVEQDGSIVYESGVVDPGMQLEWGTGVEGAHVGAATATVYAVRDGADFGNPVSVEVSIVE